MDSNPNLKSLNGIGSIQCLETLKARFCAIETIKELASLTRLSHLDLSMNCIKCIPNLSRELVYLNLSNNMLETTEYDDDNRFSFPNLKYLNLCRNYSLNITFGDNPKLEYLNIYGTSVDDFNFYNQRFPNLNEILIQHFNVSKNIESIGLMGKLTHLSISLQLKEIPNPIFLLENLISLDLSNNQISIVPNLKDYNLKWEKVNLSNNTPLKEFPKEILYIKSLKVLALFGCGCYFNHIQDDNPPRDPFQFISFYRQKFNIKIDINDSIKHVNTNDDEYREEFNEIYNFFLNRKTNIIKESKIQIKYKDNIDRSQLIDKILGCIYGGAIGDAIGLSTEFMPTILANFYYDEPLNYKDKVHDSHRSSWIEGDWTDDTDQSILIIKSIIDNNGIVDEKTFAKYLYEWKDHGIKELGDINSCGCGAHTVSILNKKGYLDDPIQCSKDVWIESGKNSAPNGAVMRTSILGVIKFWDEEEVINNTIKIAQSTHYDPRCVTNCVTITTLICKILKGEDNIDKLLKHVKKIGRRFLKDYNLDMYKEFCFFSNASLDELDLSCPSKIGYTNRAYGSAIWALRNNKLGFEDALTKIILEGGDADSNAVVAGSLLGAYLGYNNLVKRWVIGLKNRKYLDSLICKLFDLMGI